MIGLVFGVWLGTAGLTVDPAAKTVSFPCKFIQAAQTIEVFGCSPGGPTHETVVSFEPTGGEIAAALAKLGLRDEKFWQVSDAADFALTQGDRVAITLRWESRGVERTVFAEDLVWRTGEDLPELLYGFSYTGRTVAQGDPPVDKVPDLVEITLGGTGRQSAIASLLIHPSALDFLAPHVSALDVNPRFAQEIADLAAEGRTATMALRWVTETELLEARAAVEPPIPGVKELLRAQEPFAREIDGLKAKLVETRRDIAAILDARDAKDARDPTDPKDAAKGQQVAAKLLEAQRLVWRINQGYLALYAIVWGFEREMLESRLASFRNAWEKGYEFLLAYSAERVKLADLRVEAARGEPTKELAAKIRRGELRLKELGTRRMIPICRDERAFLEKRLAEARSDGSAYLEKMFLNEGEKWRVRSRSAELEAEDCALSIQEIDLELAGKVEGRAALAARRDAVAKELACLAVEGEIADIDEKHRWEEEELESGDAERRQNAQQKIAELRTQKKALEEKRTSSGCLTAPR